MFSLPFCAASDKHILQFYAYKMSISQFDYYLLIKIITGRELIMQKQ